MDDIDLLVNVRGLIRLKRKFDLEKMIPKIPSNITVTYSYNHSRDDMHMPHLAFSFGKHQVGYLVTSINDKLYKRWGNRDKLELLSEGEFLADIADLFEKEATAEEVAIKCQKENLRFLKELHSTILSQAT